MFVLWKHVCPCLVCARAGIRTNMLINVVTHTAACVCVCVCLCVCVCVCLWSAGSDWSLLVVHGASAGAGG